MKLQTIGNPAGELADYSANHRLIIPSGLALVIFWKELRETLRDRRTLFGAVVSPLVIVPLIVLAGGLFLHQQQVSESKKTYSIAIEGANYVPALTQALKNNPGLKLVPSPANAAQAGVIRHTFGCVVVVPPDAAVKLASYGTARITVLVNSANDVSQAAAARIQTAVAAYSATLRASRLQHAHLSAQFGTPLMVDEQSVKGSGSPVMLILSILLPYFLTLNALTGGMYAANDQIAGEKERGTLETLLVSPASRRDIVVGKFCAVACICLLSGVLSVVGMALPFALHAPGVTGMGASGLGSVHLGIAAIATILLAQIPLALLCTGLLIAASTLARNQKEVQVYQTPLVLAVVLPAIASISLGSDASWHYALVPVLNTGLVIKQSLSGVINPVFIAVALVSAFAYAAIAIAISVKLFNNERVLLKT